MKVSNVEDHCSTKLHKDNMNLSLRRAQETKKLLKAPPPPSPSPPSPQSTSPFIPATLSPIPLGDHQEAYDLLQQNDSERMSTSSSSTPPSPSATFSPDVCDEQFPLSQLWDPSIRMFANEELDLYSEFIAARERGDPLFTCPLHPLADEIGLDCDDMQDPLGDNEFGLQNDSDGMGVTCTIPWKITDGVIDYCNSSNQQHMDDSAYPWPSRAVRIVLFPFGIIKLFTMLR